MSLSRDFRVKQDVGSEVVEGQDLICDMSFASDEPYERWWGIEILDCTAKSVRLDRINDSGALLFNHDWDELRGHHVPGSVRCDADGVVRGQVSIAWAADDGKTVKLVQGDHLTKTSVGYEIYQVIEQTTAKSGEKIERTLDGRMFDTVVNRCQREQPGDLAAFRRALDARAGAFERAGNEPTTYRVTDWEILENSLVTIPADVTVGKGRSLASEPAAPKPESIQEISMTQEVKQPEVDLEKVEREFADKAQKRINEISAMGDQFKDFEGVKQMADQAIRNGEPVEDFTKRLMKHVSEKGTKWNAEIGMSAEETKRFSIVKAVRAMMSGDWTHAGLERAASQAFAEKAAAAGIQRQSETGFFMPIEVQRRDMTVASATGGGNMVSTDLRPQDFIELLRNRQVISALGARRLTGLIGNADITKQSGAATGYWLGSESTAITESGQTVGLLQLRPKVLGAYTEVSRLLLQQSTPDADMFIMDDLAQVLAVAIDAAAINTGGSGAPVGILGTSGIGSVTGTSIDLAKILEFQTDVAGANALNANCAYLTTPAVAALLAQRQKFSSTDTPLWTGNILDGNVLGFKGVTSLQVPAATMIFGDFSQVVQAEWGALEIASNPYANFAAGITGIRAFYTCDVGVRVAGAFSAASSIT